MTTSAAPTPRTGQPGKRQAILAGGLTVFARDGYTRAGIEAIAREAGVSTRTIYNHFQDKARLFEAVIQESARRFADAQIDKIDRYLRKVTDIEADLIDCGRALVAPMPDYAEHAALMRQVAVEADHVPRAAIDAWRATGPLRVRAELARRFAQLAERGLLAGADPELAAQHFQLLVSDGMPLYGRLGADAEATDTVAAGVRAFLYGYLPR